MLIDVYFDGSLLTTLDFSHNELEIRNRFGVSADRLKYEITRTQLHKLVAGELEECSGMEFLGKFTVVG